ncbi:MAG: acyl-CoA/acyl-ACP dehydrogenase [Dehalococcoidia bacterium]|nr:acyl-CoA/acyl-ACP dehydrogenase [Dehalococcoidia bacterium]
MPYTELNLELSEEHELLKEEVHKFAMEVLRPASLELDKLSPSEVVKKGSLYWECMARMYQNNYHTVLISDAYGGLGLDPLGVHIFWEELAYGSVGFAVSLGCSCFSSFYATMLCEDYLIDNFVTPFVNCKDASIMSCWGITEPQHGSDNLMTGTEFFRDPAHAHQVKAKRKGGKWVINGQKSAWISNGPVASDVALFVNMDASCGFSGGGICLLNLDQPGVSRGKPLDKLGQRELPQGELFFDGAECSEEAMIVDPESYESMTELTLGHANATMGAYFTGLAQAAFDLSMDYSRERVQGGKLLSEHQLVQRKLFDMFVKVETARAFSRSAMVFNMNTTPPKVQYSIGAKVFCTEAAFQVASDSVQLFGGYGVSKDFPIEKLFRDARAGLIEDGSNDSLSLAAGLMILREA